MQIGLLIGKGQTETMHETKRRRMTASEILIAGASVFCGLIACTVMILHMKVIPVTAQGSGGGTETVCISLAEKFRRWQPFLEEQGELESKIYEMTPVTEPAGVKNGMVDDGLDLDQIQEGQFCVLVLGMDESRMNTDVMLLIMMDLRGSAVHVLQIPRDTFVPGFTSFSGCKLNSVYTQGNPDKTPVQRVADCLETIFRVPIDRYVSVNCEDIAETVDLIGGVPVDMPYAITFEAGKEIPAGKQVLTGAQAEWLLRFRHDYTEGDIGRMKAQRIFMAAAMQRLRTLEPAEMLTALRCIMAEKLISSDLSVDEIAKLAGFAKQVNPERITLHLLPGEGYMYTPPDADGDVRYSVWMMHKQPVIDLLNQYFRPYFAPEENLPVAELLRPEDYQYTVYDGESTDLQKIADGETFMGQ